MRPHNDAGRVRAVIGDPPVLPLRVAGHVAWQSIKVRMSRSLVTVSSVVLAIAFLLNVVGGDIATHAVYTSFDQDRTSIEDVAVVNDLLGRQRRPIELLQLLARDRSLASWITRYDMTLPEFDQDSARRSLALVRWIQRLKATDRFRIIGNRPLHAWLLSLDQNDAQTNFFDQVNTFRGVRTPFNEKSLSEIGQHIAGLRAAITILEQAEELRMEEVRQAEGRHAILATIAGGVESSGLSTLGLPIEQMLPGFDQERYARFQLQLRLDAQRTRAGELLQEASMLDLGRPALRLAQLTDGSLNADERGQAALKGLEQELGRDDVIGLRDELLRRSRIDRLRSTFEAIGFDPDSESERTFWLLVLSLLVCIVGIVNSMMMAVTERFIEIATMKCLGAVDGFILKAFLIESGSVGLVGSTIGALLGTMLVILQAGHRFGTTFWTSLPATELMLACLAALAGGILLTIIGALLPAWKAARMHPIEAMRLEA